MPCVYFNLSRYPFFSVVGLKDVFRLLCSEAVGTDEMCLLAGEMLAYIQRTPIEQAQQTNRQKLYLSSQ